MKTTITSLHHFFLNAANNIHRPEKEFLFQKENGVFVGYSYAYALKRIQSIAAFLYQHGVRKGDKVSMILENCPEYIFFDQALMKLGAVNVSIYPTLTAEETAYILNDSESKILLLGSNFLFKKFEKIESNCLSLNKVLLHFDNKHSTEKYVPYATAIAEGELLWTKYSKDIDAITSTIQGEDLAALIYTSGTTGVPKGVMLTHYNFMSNAIDAKQLVPDINKDDRFLSFLPLSHVYERLVSYILASYIGAEVYFAESIDKVAQNFQEAKPTIVACVPRLLERVEERVRKNAASGGGLKSKIFFWAVKIGERNRLLLEEGLKPGLLLSMKRAIAEKLVFSKIKARLGGRVKIIVSGGGALPKHVGEFFGNIGIKVQEGYGLTETSPFVCVNEYNRQVFGTVGRIAPSQQVAIQDIESGEILTVQTYNSFNKDFESGEGEILVKGPNVMKGYYNKPNETSEVFDSDGWFHTGDIGKFEKGYLKITDRLKNMLKTSLGKNIYPTPIENNYLQSSKIEQIFIIGDKKEYVTAIVVPSQDELKEQFGVGETFFNHETPFVEDQNIVSWISEDMEKLSQKLAKFERVREFIVKRTPFTIEANELTVTQKQKRKVIESKYKDFIQKMY